MSRKVAGLIVTFFFGMACYAKINRILACVPRQPFGKIQQSLTAMDALKLAAKKIIQNSGYDIVQTKGLHDLREELAKSRDQISYLKGELESLQREMEAVPRFVYLWNELNYAQKVFVSRYIPFSKSQLGQDLFVLSELHSDSTSNKFFVEFGATDGIELSNTYLLEKHFGWNGILAEPAHVWRERLSRNRECITDHRCVSRRSGENVEFMEVLCDESGSLSSPELSSMSEFANSGDWASDIRLNNSRKYTVKTVSLNDLLVEHKAPQTIEYLSLDTEGSELVILQNFDFKKYCVRVITVEHNYQEHARQAIFDLLASNGYVRKYEHISLFDDWYVLASPPD